VNVHVRVWQVTLAPPRHTYTRWMCM